MRFSLSILLLPLLILNSCETYVAPPAYPTPVRNGVTPGEAAVVGLVAGAIIADARKDRNHHKHYYYNKPPSYKPGAYPRPPIVVTPQRPRPPVVVVPSRPRPPVVVVPPRPRPPMTPRPYPSSSRR